MGARRDDSASHARRHEGSQEAPGVHGVPLDAVVAEYGSFVVGWKKAQDGEVPLKIEPLR